MKIKKLLLVVSMLTVMFSLAGCNEEKDSAFEYDETQIVVDTMFLFEDFADVSGDIADAYMEAGTDFEKSAVKGIKQAVETDKVGEFEDFNQYFNGMYGAEFNPEIVDASVKDDGESVLVTVVNNAKNRPVEITVKYVENKQYNIEYAKLSEELTPEFLEQQIMQYYSSIEEFMAMTGNTSFDEVYETALAQNLQTMGVYPYVPEEMVVSAVYSKGELMKQAGMNTLLGMGTVFCVLLFISFIISLFKFLPALFAKKATVPEPKETKAVAAPVQETKVVNDDLMNDAELVAVITAAIYAATGSSNTAANGAVSKDTLVVRSIKRAKK